MQFWTLDEIEHHAMADHETGEEIAPGVTITRRRILQVGDTAFAPKDPRANMRVEGPRPLPEAPVGAELHARLGDVGEI